MPARSDIEPADFELVELADTDPAPRRPDEVPEVRRIPSSLQRLGPRERSCEKSCSDSKVFTARGNGHAIDPACASSPSWRLSGGRVRLVTYQLPVPQWPPIVRARKSRTFAMEFLVASSLYSTR